MGVNPGRGGSGVGAPVTRSSKTRNWLASYLAFPRTGCWAVRSGGRPKSYPRGDLYRDTFTFFNGGEGARGHPTANRHNAHSARRRRLRRVRQLVRTVDAEY